MRKYYKFAGVELEFDIPDPMAYTDERYLEPFAALCAEAPYRFVFRHVDTTLFRSAVI